MNDFERMLRRWKNALKSLFGENMGSRERKGRQRPAVKMCPICRGLVDVRAAVCEYCQADLAPQPQRTVDERGNPLAEPLNPSMIIFGVCILFLMIAIFLSSRMEDYNLMDHLWAPHGEVLARMGANLNPRVFENGEIWRISTYMFLHGNLFHILFNIMALAQLGPLTFMGFGTRRFWLITFVTGIGGGWLSASTWLIGWPNFSTGFSGVLFGYIGACYMLFRAHGPYYMADRFKKFMIWGNAICIGLTVLNLMPIDNMAHIGGMLAGLGIGALFQSKWANKLSETLEWSVIAACLAFWGYGMFRSFQFVQEYFFR